MNDVQGTYRGGRVEVDTPVDWPEGSRVTIIREQTALGLTESDWPDTPETRKALIEKIDAIEPLELTPEDISEIDRARDAVREISIRSVREKMGLP
jgi:hypothetical protein